MSENSHFFTIGDVSKMTGVHIHSLRYYEKLGILVPAHKDEETGYRYYTYWQIKIVEAIQRCVELDIPLKEFPRFVCNDTGRIDCAALLERGKQITQEKLKKLLDMQVFLDKRTGEISHAMACLRQGEREAWLPEKYYYCLPYEGAQTGSQFDAEMLKLVEQMNAQGFQGGYQKGILLWKTEGEVKRYLCLEIWHAEEEPGACPAVRKLPSGRYLCKVSEESCIEAVPELFQEQFAQGGGIAIEVELFEEKYDCKNPPFELRCYLGA